MSVTVAATSRNKALNAALETDCDAGYVNIYSGPVPTNADAALSGNTLLVQLRFGTPAFGGASGGIATANSISAGTAVATATPSFFRVLKSDGTTVILQGSVAASGADLNLSGMSGGQITSGDTVSASSMTVGAT